jgi:hypothetical protein
LVRKVHKVQLDHKVLLEHKVQQDQLESLVVKVFKVYKVLKDQLVQQEFKVLKDRLVQQGKLVFRVLQETQVLLECKVL